MLHLTEMVLHRLDIGEGHGKTDPDTPSRADCAEEVSTFVALVCGLARPRPTPRPLPDSSVLLPDARLILEPDFDLPATCAWWQMRFQRRGEIFYLERFSSEMDTISREEPKDRASENAIKQEDRAYPALQS